MTPVEFEVVGLPAAQGSKRHVGNGVMVETSKNLKPWRAAVAAAARDIAADVGQYDEPLHMEVVFRFPMPKSRRAGVRAVGIASKTTAPDLLRDARQDPQPASDDPSDDDELPFMSPRQHLEALLAGRDDAYELIECAARWGGNAFTEQGRWHSLIGDAARGGA
jgi:hypothetical protein